MWKINEMVMNMITDEHITCDAFDIDKIYIYIYK